MAAVYDDIIVGAGSSGAVIAARLSEDPERAVLLLEAGPDYASLDQLPDDLRNGRQQSVRRHDWGFHAQVSAEQQIDYPRGKVTGGSSSVNSAIALRGTPEDYDEWAEMGNGEWAWSKVLPYFRKLEDDRDESGDFHGKGGPLPIKRPETLQPEFQAFVEACTGLGMPLSNDHNDPEAWGVGTCARNIIEDVRMSTGLAYLAPARHRLNLTIRGGCLVRRVLIEDGRAVGVEVESGGDVQHVLGKRITLSAGAILSPAILVRSGIGPKETLTNLGITQVAELPVGETLIDHCMSMVFGIPKPGVFGPDNYQIQTMARYTATGSDERNDMQLYPVTVDFTDYPDYIALLGTNVALGVAAGLQRPKSRGRLRFDGAGADAQPRIELDYFADQDDLARMVDGLRLAWKVANSPQMAPFIESFALLNDDAMTSDDVLGTYAKMAVNTIYHPVATCRMGPEGDPGAVVDQHCRVRGIEGLRVADASVMPNIPRANTNLTCIMIGEKVADWLKAEA